MSFQAYLDNIRAKTGRTPAALKALAAKAGVYSPDMNATALVDWLKKEFGLGHGHSMAIWAVFKDEGWVDATGAKEVGLQGRRQETMWTSSVDDLDADTRFVRVFRDGVAAPYGAVIDALRTDAAFRGHLVETLAAAPHSAFVWETRPVSARRLETPFEFVTVHSPALAAMRADASAFAEHLAPTPVGQGTVTFPNLGGDATLVVPTPQMSPEVYGHLAAFIRGAPDRQRHQLLQAVGHAVDRRLAAAPIWLSTAGLGVAWLHVRVDSTPKYYRYRAFCEYEEPERRPG